MKLELVVQKDVSHVELMKDYVTSLGLVIRDGIQDETGPVIKKVKSKSLAERSHAVAEGDIVLSLNGREVMGTRAVDVRRMMEEAGPKIDLKVQYEIKKICISLPGVYRKQRMTTKLHKVDGSFGFVLRKKVCRQKFSVEFPIISHIKQGGPAQKDSQMQEGDRLLKIDDMSLNWMSLVDVASILQEKDEAEFTFEYNVRVVNISWPDDRWLEVETNIPLTDLDIGISLFLKNPRDICIGSIQVGSIAERCGLFSKGDRILSVNEVKMDSLNVAKANSLLRSARMIRKLSYISAKAFPQFEHLSHSQNEKYATSSSSSICVQEVDFGHCNTPTSTNTTLSSRDQSNLTKFSHEEQVKIIKKFQNMVKRITVLKQNLSRLTRKAFEGESMDVNNENCSACNRTQYSVKLCTSCLANMNVKCAQSMGLLSKIVAIFVSISARQCNQLNPGDAETKTVPKTISGNYLGRVDSKNMIHSLEKILPKIFAGNPELHKTFRGLADKIVNSDSSCSTCKNGINSVSLTVQKLLLLVSLNDPSTDIKALINQLVYCLRETKVTCGEEPDSLDSTHNNENCDCESENSHSSILPSVEGASLEDEGNVSLNIADQAASETRSNETGMKEELNSENSFDNSRLNINLHKESAFFKITHISNSDSENAQSSNEFDETQKLDHSDGVDSLLYDKNFAATSETNLLEDSTQPSSSKNFVVNTNKKILKDKKVRCSKVWKSLDTFLNLRKSFRIKPDSRNDSDQNSNPAEICKSKNMNPFAAAGCSYENPPQHMASKPGLKKHSKSNKRNDSELKKDSMHSSVKQRPAANKNEVESEKVRVETVDVKIEKDREGFGFALGYSSSNFSNTLPVPIITDVKFKSPAHRVGNLQKKDRVLAINHQSIVGVPLKDLENIKRKVFSLDHVILTIEFDVVETELKFGTFDVVLDRKFSPGLIFKDPPNGSPMAISGVVKGSIAHRSGQLFPGDKVTLFKCVRNEEFNPLTRRYIKEDCVIITVQRNPIERITESPIQQLPSHSCPVTYNPGCSPQSGINFIVRNTSVRPAETTDALILDQEITLFRDPLSWCFGFQVGENPETGRAYVTDVKPGGPASASGVIKKFDRIVEVNGIIVGRRERCSVQTLLNQVDEKLDLLIRRLYHQEINNPSL